VVVVVGNGLGAGINRKVWLVLTWTPPKGVSTLTFLSSPLAPLSTCTLHPAITASNARPANKPVALPILFSVEIRNGFRIMAVALLTLLYADCRWKVPEIEVKISGLSDRLLWYWRRTGSRQRRQQ
jgi:hypothetical protein